jgi:hypothetical protein
LQVEAFMDAARKAGKMHLLNKKGKASSAGAASSLQTAFTLDDLLQYSNVSCNRLSMPSCIQPPYHADHHYQKQTA